jgi:site-specific recombinase XerD
LRHCFASHLLDANLDIRTMIYTHLARNRRVRSPADDP